MQVESKQLVILMLKDVMMDGGLCMRKWKEYLQKIVGTSRGDLSKSRRNKTTVDRLAFPLRY